MTLHIDALEALWLVLNVATLTFTVVALIEAYRDFLAVKNDTDHQHEARMVTAKGNIRRESLRIVANLLLLSIVIPGLFSDRLINLSPILIALMLVPVVLLIATIYDARDRAKLSGILLEIVRYERGLQALESSVQKNIRLTEVATDHAEKAYKEANNVNEKIAETNERIAGLIETLGVKEDKQTSS